MTTPTRLIAGDPDAATKLCVAAASSNTDYAKVKASHFSDKPVIAEKVACNGMPLDDFARRYGNEEFSI